MATRCQLNVQTAFGICSPSFQAENRTWTASLGAPLNRVRPFCCRDSKLSACSLFLTVDSTPVKPQGWRPKRSAGCNNPATSSVHHQAQRITPQLSSGFKMRCSPLTGSGNIRLLKHLRCAPSVNRGASNVRGQKTSRCGAVEGKRTVPHCGDCGFLFALCLCLNEQGIPLLRGMEGVCLSPFSFSSLGIGSIETRNQMKEFIHQFKSGTVINLKFDLTQDQPYCSSNLEMDSQPIELLEEFRVWMDAVVLPELINSLSRKQLYNFATFGLSKFNQLPK